MISTIILLTVCWLAVSGSLFKLCMRNDENTKRKLVISTCDSRNDSQLLNVFHSTGDSLRSSGVHFANACLNKNWNGFDSKVRLYLSYLRKVARSKRSMKHQYALFTDSDTFWSVDSLDNLWSSFDCARDGKPALISSESNCYVGVACTKEILQIFYNRTDRFPTYSPFINAGVIMGRIDVLIKMFKYVLNNQSSYLVKNHGVSLQNASFPQDYHFDDQYAITDYVTRIAPQDFAVDYHQQLSAGFLFLSSIRKGPSVCVFRDGSMHKQCNIVTRELEAEHTFHFDERTCRVTRQVHGNMTFYPEMEGLSLNPVLGHGNGEFASVDWSVVRFNVVCCRTR